MGSILEQIWQQPYALYLDMIQNAWYGIAHDTSDVMSVDGVTRHSCLAYTKLEPEFFSASLPLCSACMAVLERGEKGGSRV